MPVTCQWPNKSCQLVLLEIIMSDRLGILCSFIPGSHSSSFRCDLISLQVHYEDLKGQTCSLHLLQRVGVLNFFSLMSSPWFSIPPSLAMIAYGAAAALAQVLPLFQVLPLGHCYLGQVNKGFMGTTAVDTFGQVQFSKCLEDFLPEVFWATRTRIKVALISNFYTLFSRQRQSVYCNPLNSRGVEPSLAFPDLQVVSQYFWISWHPRSTSSSDTLLWLRYKDQYFSIRSARTVQVRRNVKETLADSQWLWKPPPTTPWNSLAKVQSLSTQLLF